MSINLTLISSVGYPEKPISAFPSRTLAMMATESTTQFEVMLGVTAPEDV
jgi:hypothetical protein